MIDQSDIGTDAALCVHQRNVPLRRDIMKAWEEQG